MNELEAYDTELRMADKLGLPRTEVESITRLRREHFDVVRGIPEYVANIQAGNYAPIKGRR